MNQAVLKSRFQRWGLLLLLIGLAFGVRAVSLTAQPLWRDEVDALCFAHQFSHLLVQAIAPDGEAGGPPLTCPPSPVPPPSPDAGLLHRLAEVLRPMVRQNGPLYFLLLRGWIGLTGSSAFALRYFSLWFGVLAVPLTYLLGRRLLGRMEGGLAALLVALSPYLTWYAQEVKMYTLTPALALLAIYALRRATVEGGFWRTVQVVATSLAFYIHVWSALLVPIQVLLLLMWWPRWRSRWREALLSMALLTLPYLPLALWQARSVFVRRETGFSHFSLSEMALILLGGWSLGPAAWGWLGGVIACGELALLGLSDRLTGKGGAAAELLTWLILPVGGIWFISQWQPLFTDRYLIWAAPAFYLLVAAGLSFLWRRGRPRDVRLLLVILVIFGGNLWTQATTPIKPDLRGVADYLEEAYRPGELIIFQIPHVRYTFDYYFSPRDYVWEDGPFTNHREQDGAYQMTEEEAGIQMAQITQGYRSVWLVASEVGMWDERNLTQEWLEANGERTVELHFTQVDLYRYQMGATTRRGRPGCTGFLPSAAHIPWGRERSVPSGGRGSR